MYIIIYIYILHMKHCHFRGISLMFADDQLEMEQVWSGCRLGSPKSGALFGTVRWMVAHGHIRVPDRTSTCGGRAASIRSFAHELWLHQTGSYCIHATTLKQQTLQQVHYHPIASAETPHAETAKDAQSPVHDIHSYAWSLQWSTWRRAGQEVGQPP